MTHWQGQLHTNNDEAIPFALSLQLEQSDTTNPFSSSNLSGVFTTNTTNPCFSGGSISSGTQNGNAIEFSVTHEGGNLDFSGSVSDQKMSGNWSNAGEITLSTPITTTNADGETETSVENSTINCYYSGTFSAR